MGSQGMNGGGKVATESAGKVMLLCPQSALPQQIGWGGSYVTLSPIGEGNSYPVFATGMVERSSLVGASCLGDTYNDHVPFLERLSLTSPHPLCPLPPFLLLASGTQPTTRLLYVFALWMNKYPL